MSVTILSLLFTNYIIIDTLKTKSYWSTSQRQFVLKLF